MYHQLVIGLFQLAQVLLVFGRKVHHILVLLPTHQQHRLLCQCMVRFLQQRVVNIDN